MLMLAGSKLVVTSQASGVLVLNSVPDLRFPSGPAEGADGAPRQGDGEGAQQKLPAAAGTVRGGHSETPGVH